MAIGIVGVGLSVLFPWIRSFHAFPDESIDIAAIYRGDSPGDIQYFPLISQLARGTVSDGTIKELEGSVLRSFPHVTLLPHAIFLAAFGNYGFLVTDVFVTVCYFLLVVFLFRTAGIPDSACILTACFLALNIPFNLTLNLTLGPASSSFPFLPGVWGMRIPRPFVSELFLIAALIAAMQLLLADRSHKWHWFWLGLTHGVLVQGDVYTALTFALMSPFLIISLAQREGLRTTLWNGMYSGVIFCIVVTPFLMQRYLEHPDIPTRWGVFELARTAGIKIFWRQLFAPTFAIAFICICRLILKQRKTDDQASPVHEHCIRSISRTWWFLALLLCSAYSCASISIFLLGKTIQPYHFNDRAERICSYVVFIYLGYTVLAICQQLNLTRLSSRWRRKLSLGVPYGGMTILVLGFLGYTAFAKSNQPQIINPVRGVYYAHAIDADPAYRTAFSELTQFMKQNLPRETVVASFDHQVFAWWLTFHGRYWFLVEPFVSSIPDEELELRLSIFCKLIGMSSDDYLAFIQTPIQSQPNIHGYVNVFWLGLAKYQATKLHTFALIDDYTEEQRPLIAQSDYSWQTIIPQSELARLARQYDRVTASDWETRSIDAIVLGNGAPESPWAPPTTDWELIFQNKSFRLFTRTP